MDRVILQIPLSKKLKQEAEAVSSNYGFSSLQELIRVLLNKLAKRQLTISVQEVEEINYLKPSAARRYKKALNDIKKEKNIFKPKDSKEFLKMLRS